MRKNYLEPNLACKFLARSRNNKIKNNQFNNQIGKSKSKNHQLKILFRPKTSKNLSDSKCAKNNTQKSKKLFKKN